MASSVDNPDTCVSCRQIVEVKIYPSQLCDCQQTWCCCCFREYYGNAKRKPCVMCGKPYANKTYDMATRDEMKFLDAKYKELISCPYNCGWEGSRITYVDTHMDRCDSRPLKCATCNVRKPHWEHYKYCSHCPIWICGTLTVCSKCYTAGVCTFCRREPSSHKFEHCDKCKKDIKLCYHEDIKLHYDSCEFILREDLREAGRKRAISELSKIE
jgi:hypothetical protein